MSDWHLAQLNVARLHAPIDDPMIADFVNALDEINELAEANAGFVWRMQDDAGNNTGVHPYGDELIITNLSVWESIEQLFDFAYKTHHVDYLRRKREWFQQHAEAHLALWWIKAGEIPTIEEAVARLASLRAEGPTPNAFTFREQFPPPA